MLKISDAEVAALHPKEFRSLARQGEWTGLTLQACRGYAQANLAIVPAEMAFEFLLFCNRNPRPCPVLDVTEPGDPHPRLVAPEADLRTDLPRYRVFKDGKLVDEPTDILKYWRDDLVGFLLGCSASFDWSLKAANLNYRLTGAYTSNIPCVPAGRFHGPVVVSCRLFKSAHDAVRAIQISSRHNLVHGKPVHIGNPAAIGIKDLCHSDVADLFGTIAPPKPNEIALYWGCGVTPQAVALAAKPSLMITHWPGYMFITDKLSEELVVV